MFRYKYVGKNSISVPRVGIVKPGYVFYSSIALIHPLFERVAEDYQVPVAKIVEEKKKMGKKKRKH